MEDHWIFDRVRGVKGARIEVWLRVDGTYGVTIVPDGGGSHSYASTDNHANFPDVYERKALLAWARKRWRRERLDTR